MGRASGAEACDRDRAMTDALGNRCAGTVVEIGDRGVVTIALDLTTLIHGKEPASAER